MKKSNENFQANPNFGKKLGGWIIKWRWAVLITTVALAVWAGSQGFPIFNNDYHVFFSKENPQLQAYDALQAKYTKDDNIFILIEPKDSNVFTRKTLAALEDLVEESWQVPFSTRVDGLTNYQHTKAVEDDLYVDDLVFEAETFSDSQLAEIKEIATHEKLLLNRLINEEGTLTGININIQLPGEKETENVEVVQYVREMVSKFEQENPNLKTYLSGMIMLTGAFQESAMGDMTTLVPLMFLVILLVTFITTRTVTGTVSTLIVIFMSIITAMGLANALGIQLTPPSSSALTMIVTLAVADSIHVIVSLRQLMQKGLSKLEAIAGSLQVNFMPILITSLTTVIGFLSMNSSDSPPFRDLGNITAMGMAAAFLFSTLTLPALMAILPVKIKKREEDHSKTGIYNKLASLIIQNEKKILWGSLGVILILASLSTTLKFNEDFIKYFDDSITFRTDTDYIGEAFTGIYTAEFSVPAGESGGINNPDYLARLEQFEHWLEEQENVKHVSTFTQVARKVNKSMHGDDPAYFKIPDNREEAAQYLLLYEMSLPFGLDLNNQINVDKSETRVIVTLDNVPTQKVMAFSEKAEQWLKDNTPTMAASGASTSLMFAHLTNRQFYSMIWGTATAILLISLILMFALRSFKYGLISLLPNTLPVAVGFGIWAVLVGDVNVGNSIVFGMTLGIIVDDTIHFLYKYLGARKQMNYSAPQAVRYAFNTVGRALVVTTIILVAGFMVLAQSSFGLNSGMAQMTGIVISAALVIDFLLLPALLLAVDRRNKVARLAQETRPELSKAS